VLGEGGALNLVAKPMGKPASVLPPVWRQHHWRRESSDGYAPRVGEEPTHRWITVTHHAQHGAYLMSAPLESVQNRYAGE